MLTSTDYRGRVSNDVLFAYINRTVIARTPKVGQTSIAHTLGGQIQVPLSEIGEFDRRIVFVRDPIERLESTYHYFDKKQGSWPNAFSNRQDARIQHRPQSIEEFIDLILDHAWLDKHWVPQSWLWEQIPDPDYIGFEDFGKTFRSLGFQIKHENSSGVKRSGITHRIPELEALFAGDLAIRESLDG